MAFRATRAALSSVKQTTGIVGLAVEPNARPILLDLYNQFLEKIKIIPEDVYFRTFMSNVNAYRLKTVEENEDIEVIEAMNDDTQVEELIEMVKNDLYVIDLVFKYRLWESSDFDEFEMEDDLRSIHGESFELVGEDHPLMKHGYGAVMDYLRAQDSGDVPPDGDYKAHNTRYLNVLRRSMYGEERMQQMAKEDAERAATAAERA